MIHYDSIITSSGKFSRMHCLPNFILNAPVAEKAALEGQGNLGGDDEEASALNELLITLANLFFLFLINYKSNYSVSEGEFDPCFGCLVQTVLPDPCMLSIYMVIHKTAVGRLTLWSWKVTAEHRPGLWIKRLLGARCCFLYTLRGCDSNIKTLLITLIAIDWVSLGSLILSLFKLGLNLIFFKIRFRILQWLTL